MTSLNLFGHELVVDNFAGGGGASEGIEQALADQMWREWVWSTAVYAAA